MTFRIKSKRLCKALIVCIGPKHSFHQSRTILYGPRLTAYLLARRVTVVVVK